MDNKDKKIIIEIIGDDIDKFIQIRKPNGDLFIENNSVQFYIDKDNGLRWDENDIEALLRFLGFDIFKIIKQPKEDYLK